MKKGRSLSLLGLLMHRLLRVSISRSLSKCATSAWCQQSKREPKSIWKVITKWSCTRGRSRWNFNSLNNSRSRSSCKSRGGLGSEVTTYSKCRRSEKSPSAPWASRHKKLSKSCLKSTPSEKKWQSCNNSNKTTYSRKNKTTKSITHQITNLYYKKATRKRHK